MKVGRVETSWTANCLAIGLAQGFIEPLEATALHIVQATIEGFIGAYQAGSRDAFNAAIARRYDGIRDYIVAHYRLNRRSGLLARRRRQRRSVRRPEGDHDRVVHRRRRRRGGRGAGPCRLLCAMSWEVLLAGYGTFPDATRLRTAPPVADLAAIDTLLSGACSTSQIIRPR